MGDPPIEQGIIKRCVEADGSDYSQVKMIPSTVTDEVSALKTDQVDCIWIFWAAFYAWISENGISEEQIPAGAGLTMQFQK